MVCHLPSASLKGAIPFPTVYLLHLTHPALSLYLFYAKKCRYNLYIAMAICQDYPLLSFPQQIRLKVASRNMGPTADPRGTRGSPLPFSWGPRWFYKCISYKLTVAWLTCGQEVWFVQTLRIGSGRTLFSFPQDFINSEVWCLTTIASLLIALS